MPANDYQRYASDELRKRRRKRTVCELLIAALILLPALLLSFSLKPLINYVLFSNVQLRPASKGFQTWLNPPISTVRKYYLFNITNPLEIVRDPKDARIRFQDSPAYAYNIQTKKRNVQWAEDRSTLSYEVERLYTRAATFDPQSVNDTGVFVDMTRAGSRTQFEVKPAPSFYASAGYNPFLAAKAVDLLEGLQSDLHQTVRERMKGPNTEKFGFIYRQNGSRLYNVSINTETFIKGQVLTFGSELVSFNLTSIAYPFPIYDSLTYPADLSRHQTLNLFNSDFCKPVLLEYRRTVTMFDGVEMFEYKLKLVDYENCSDPKDPRTCPEVEKLDVSRCISDSLPPRTIFLSKAHFYGAANETLAEMNVEGYAPSREQHESVLYFEPTTGTPFQATYRMQLNVEVTIDPMTVSGDNGELQPAGKKGVKRLVPVFWIDQDIKLDPALIAKLRKALRVRQMETRFVIPVAIGLVVLIIVLMEIVGRRADKSTPYTRNGYTIARS